MRIRGNAIQVHEKYLGLARDAASAGDRVAAENYYQHAEHYFRIYSVDQEERAQRQSGSGQAGDQQRRHAGNGGGQPNGHARNDERGEVNGNGNTNGVNGEESPTVALAPESAIELPDSEEDEEAASASADEPQQQKPARRPRRRRPASSD